MSAEYLVIGHFDFIDDTQSAISKLREEGFEDLKLYSPIPQHDLEDEMYKGKPRSNVRRFTLVGGLSGCTLAFLMTIWMSMDWPLRTSAKTIISIPAFVVVAFECTILLGGIFTLIGMLHYCRVPNFFRAPGFRPNFNEGTFGLTVRVAKEEVTKAKELLGSLGAGKVEEEYVR